jgi:hypothetical protein
MSSYDDCLFGGSGYLGTHLADALVRQGRRVCIIDTATPAVNVGAAFLSSPFTLPTVGRLWLLACPRNKPRVWNARNAETALCQGMSYELMAHDKPIFISSMSVYDEPDNSYAQFKRMAEMVVAQRKFMVARLPTLLGAKQGLVYRADLGLHQAAMDLADDQIPVLSSTCRYVLPISQVVGSLVAHDFTNPEWIEIEAGVVQFHDIEPVADTVEQSGYCAGGGAPMQSEIVERCRTAWHELVELIRTKQVTAI